VPTLVASRVETTRHWSTQRAELATPSATGGSGRREDDSASELSRELLRGGRERSRIDARPFAFELPRDRQEEQRHDHPPSRLGVAAHRCRRRPRRSRGSPSPPHAARRTPTEPRDDDHRVVVEARHEVPPLAAVVSGRSHSRLARHLAPVETLACSRVSSPNTLAGRSSRPSCPAASPDGCSREGLARVLRLPARV